ncbi:MAG: family 43 glycosylhydrolase [Lewinella sp.]|nr:family 43 glycosylhydrolase [Lewinella sp.]
MRNICHLIYPAIILLAACSTTSREIGTEENLQRQPASKPLYRDPIYDGAADPSVIRNQVDGKWYMCYTNRRANVDTLTDGVSWVHGTRIGMAVSEDGGTTWTYRDTCDIGYYLPGVTYWAPEVIFHEDTYHMYLTIVPGIFSDWSHPRHIIHLTSDDLQAWEFQSQLELVSDKCIDACVFRLPDGNWRLYYNNERDNKSIYYADSPDLYHWTDSGQKVIGDERGEGPKVFQWKDRYWMVVDNWKGLGVYSSDDMTHWQRQTAPLLDEPGTGADDGAIGQHPDVVVTPAGRAFLFYFTHPEHATGGFAARRTSIQVVELEMNAQGEIVCDRNKPVFVNLDE